MVQERTRRLHRSPVVACGPARRGRRQSLRGFAIGSAVCASACETAKRQLRRPGGPAVPVYRADGRRTDIAHRPDGPTGAQLDPLAEVLRDMMSYLCRLTALRTA